MAKTIWKFPLRLGISHVLMPKNAEVLAVQSQFESPELWALCESENDKEARLFCIMTTGFVYHAFELSISEVAPERSVAIGMPKEQEAGKQNV